MLDLSKTLNPRVCGYTLLAYNIEKYVEKGNALSKKITVNLNYLRSEGCIALTPKRNCAKWHKDCTLEVEVISSRLIRALNNVSEKKTENELPTKIMRPSLPGRRVVKRVGGISPFPI